MQIYNFDKVRKDINIDLRNREAESKRRYYFQLNLYEKNKDYFEEKKDNNVEKNKEILVRTMNNQEIGDFSGLGKRPKVISNIKFKYNIFRSCKFENIKFINCCFYGSSFLNCNFNNILFESCYFFDNRGNITIFNNKTKFESVCFKNCNIAESVFENTSFYNINFISTNLKDVIISDSYIDKICITDSDCRSLKIINPEIKDFKFDDNFLTKFDEYTFIDEIKIDKNYKKTYEIASKIYRNFSTKFEANRLMDNCGEYYYLSKCMEHKSLSGMNKIKSTIFWSLCGYGERPTYALVTSLEIVLIFAVIYMFTGLNVRGELISYNLFNENIIFNKNLVLDFMKSLYFSIVTFTTVGYGDITPINTSVFLSGIEMLLGLTMVGVWTATLARKITR